MTVQDLRSLNQIFVQDLFKSSVGKVAMSSLKEVPWQDLCTRSLEGISIQAPYNISSATSPYKISRRGVLAKSLYNLQKRSLWQDLCPLKIYKKASLPRSLHTISLTLKVSTKPPRELEKVAQRISKFAPCHSESDLTGPKGRNGCASTCETHHEKLWKINIEHVKSEVLPCFAYNSQPRFCRGLQGAARQLFSCPKSKIIIISQDDTFVPFKTSSKFTK